MSGPAGQSPFTVSLRHCDRPRFGRRVLHEVQVCLTPSAFLGLCYLSSANTPEPLTCPSSPFPITGTANSHLSCNAFCEGNVSAAPKPWDQVGGGGLMVTAPEALSGAKEALRTLANTSCAHSYLYFLSDPSQPDLCTAHAFADCRPVFTPKSHHCSPVWSNGK